MRSLVLGLLLLVSVISQGQVLSGKVIDVHDREPLVGALLTLSNGQQAISDENGQYQLTTDQPGRFQVTVEYIGYKQLIISDVVLKKDRAKPLEIGLIAQSLQLEQITVKDRQPFQVSGKRMIDEDQLYRFASTYYDPARILTTSPDVMITNDQNNQVSVRGLSPVYNIWRLEDVEIVNPNHLTNAGTLNDQPSGAGGGVNAISAQVLDRSSFNYGAMPSLLSNSVGGIFDLRLKSGNEGAFQYSTQASLIGIDLMADGPLGKNTQLLTNYRYSFTGLLSQFGVDFGGESIGYQDLTVVSNTNLKRGGQLKVFAIGGNSFNDFEHTGANNAARQKDLSDINYEGSVGVIGMRYNKKSWSISYASSGTIEMRDEHVYNLSDEPFYRYGTENRNTINSALIQKKIRLQNGSIVANVGINSYRFLQQIEQDTFDQDDRWSEVLGHMGADWQFFIGERMITEVGAKVYQSTGNQAFDYRMKLDYFIGASSIYLAFGQYNQLLNPSNVYFEEVGFSPLSNFSSDFITSTRSMIGLDWLLAEWTGNIEAFVYHFDEVNILSLGQVGAETMGVSFSTQRNAENGWFALLGGTVFNSTYHNEFNNKYNSRYNSTVSVGKAYELSDDGRKRLELSMRQTVQGGNWVIRVPELVTTASDRLFIASPADKIQTAPYLRTDFRLQYVKAKSKTTRIISIDIQNLLNKENDSYFYYDSFLNQEIKNTQLGMIPNLTYRIDF